MMMSNWKSIEQQFATKFNAKLLHTKYYQNKDIDAISKNGNTVSIKAHWAAKHTGCIAFELELIDPDTGQSIDGNIKYCKADLHADYVDGVWRLFKAEELKEFVLGNTDNYPITYTKGKTEEGNRNWGAGKFRRSKLLIIPIEDLEHLVFWRSK